MDRRQPEGHLNLVALDSAFCVPQAPGNKAYCDPNGKMTACTDLEHRDSDPLEQEGRVQGAVDHQRRFAAAAGHLSPVKCSPALFGYIYANQEEPTPATAKTSRPSPSTTSARRATRRRLQGHQCGAAGAQERHFGSTPTARTRASLPLRPARSGDRRWRLDARHQRHHERHLQQQLRQDDQRQQGLLKSFQRVFFSDVLVKPGDYKQTSNWASFHKAGNGNQTLDARIKQGGTGSYGVDYNVNPPTR